MTPEKVDIVTAKTALTAVKILPGKMSTWIHLFKDNFSSAELYTTNRWLFKKLKLYHSLKKTFLN